MLHRGPIRVPKHAWHALSFGVIEVHERMHDVKCIEDGILSRLEREHPLQRGVVLQKCEDIDEILL